MRRDEIKPIDPHVLDILNEQDWPSILRKLTIFAENRVHYLNKFSKADLLPRAFDAKDLAMEAIESVYGGFRKWDPAQKPDLLAALKDIVSSRSGQFVYSPERSKMLDIQPKDDDTTNVVSNFPDQRPPADEQLAARELEEELFAEVSGDDDLELLLYERLLGKKRSEIAESLGINPSEVDSMLKRLKRKLSIYRER